eukprot:CAMPEP_0185788066 /NCGR_PEP_ID=MMETSP1174-20130828/144094_1 /TAXON_ID=35687 /ORGANISM="Dictyocha speculum, Strain CCMP1381" /LENGTH=39 /DNA_ID= /DNA_START= /DNA_END= /DNA_ORIENTATION=
MEQLGLADDAHRHWQALRTALVRTTLNDDRAESLSSASQ